MQNPRLLSLTLTAANTAYQLLALLAAADTAFTTNAIKSAQSVSIQVDIDEGAARVFIGNSDLNGTTNCGRVLVATQVYGSNSWTGYDVSLADIYVSADTSTTLIHVEVVQ